MTFRAAVAAMALSALAACGGRFETDFAEQIPAEVARGWRVTDVQVLVPDTLTVSERNVMAPDADIVWHGDIEGDRRAQVAAIVRDGIAQGASALQGARPVVITATVQEFHAMTPRAVTSAPAGVHNITFSAQVFDGATAEPLTPPQEIHTDLEAHVGAAAVIAAQEGRTQKVRITAHIARVVAAWLSAGPDIRETFVSIGR